MSRMRSYVAATAILFVGVSLWPSTALAQRSRGSAPRQGTAVRAPARATVYRVPVFRTSYYRHYRPLFWGPFGWSGFGWYDYGWYGSGWYPQRWPVGYPYYWGPRYVSSSIRIQVEPKHAEVYVDGYIAGQVDNFDGTFQRLNVEPGEHEITIYLEGYVPMQRRMYLEPHRSYRIAGALKALAAGEAARPRPVPAEPPPDRPAMEGRPGMPPEGRRPMPYEPRTGREEQAMVPEGFGQVVLRVQPADAQVLIDGEEWSAPQDQDRLAIDLPAGEHRIEVRKDGYKTYTATVQVRPGETRRLNVSLLM